MADAAKELGITLAWEGEGINDQGRVAKIEGDKAPAVKVGDVIVKIDPRYFRPAEVETLLGDPTKAKEKLGWVPKITLDEMVEEMVACDLIRQSNMRCLSGRGLRFLWGGSDWLVVAIS